MLKQLFYSFKDVFWGNLKGLILWTLAITISIYALIFSGAILFINWLVKMDTTWLQNTTKVFSFVGVVVISIFMFPTIVSIVSSLFMDKVVEKTVPNRKLRELPFSESLKMNGVVTAKSILATSFLTPLTLLLCFIPVINVIPPVLYYAINGKLLSKEYFLAVATRFMTYDEANKKYGKNKFFWFKAGIVTVFLMTIPVLNMIAPLISTVFVKRLYLIQEDQ